MGHERALAESRSTTVLSVLGVVGRWTLLRHTVVAVVGAAILFGVLEGLSDYRDTQLNQVALTACAAAGLTLLTGLSGQISLGHGAFMAVGAYTYALLQHTWETSHANVQIVGLLAAAVVVSAVIGAVVGVAAARLRGPYLAGATLAFALGLPSLASYEKLSQHLGGSQGLTITIVTPPSGFGLYKWQAVICCAAAVITLWFVANVARSRVGRSFRAVRDDEVAAALCGLSVPRVQILAFVISAGCAGLGGALLALVSLVASPGAFPLSLSLALLTAIVFGGLGSLAGVVYGSILVAMMPQWAQDLASALSIHNDNVVNNLPLVVYGVVLAAAMLLFPFGLQGALLRLRYLVGSLRHR